MFVSRNFLQTSAAVFLAASATLAATDSATAQTVLANNDGIIRNSLCVGFDCLNNESFGSDTIRLKENNLQIHFEDTSVGAFPTNDWRIIANDSTSGGSNYLGIQDATAGRMIFRATAGAPANSTFIDSTGRVGFRTAAPVLDLHVNTGNTPGVRLEQNNSGGFTAQTWDIAGNEANFFVRDVTGGSRLPLRIRPGAPTSSIDISASGNVGIGTASPNTRLHVISASAGAADVLRFENPGGVPRMVMRNGATDTSWLTLAAANYVVRVDGGPNLLSLTSAGNLTIPGTLTTSGSCSVGCDRVFSEDYDLPTIGEHAGAMFGNGYLPAVGPTIEGKPMNLTRKVEGILNELEKAHIYIEQLHRRTAELEAALQEKKVN